MTAEQRAVLRAAAERFDEVGEPTVDRTVSTSRPVWVDVRRGNDRQQLKIYADGTTRSNGAYVPVRLYGEVPKDVAGQRAFGEGLPKRAVRYLEEERNRSMSENVAEFAMKYGVWRGLHPELPRVLVDDRARFSTFEALDSGVFVGVVAPVAIPEEDGEDPESGVVFDPDEGFVVLANDGGQFQQVAVYLASGELLAETTINEGS